jgi:hypothetical protein
MNSATNLVTQALGTNMNLEYLNFLLFASAVVMQYVTSRKVAGSMPDEVIGFFSLHNSSASL